jgi:hypothetical protein
LALHQYQLKNWLFRNLNDLNTNMNEIESCQKPFIDLYTDPTSRGKTIGSTNDKGIVRKGIDREKLIGIDNGALRFQPLLNHGWGKQGIAYGSYQRANGLAFATLILNGHNTSQAEPIESLLRRIYTWIRGSKVQPWTIRLWNWLFWKHNQKFTRRLLWWFRLSSQVNKVLPVELLNENLAVGWFPSEVPLNPLKEGNNFVVHATGVNNGELWTRVGDNILSTFKNLQNIQVYYIVILREKGAAYYAAATPNAYGLTAYPYMRPLAIDPFHDDPEVYGAIYQSTLGQIGFRVDTRVYGSAIASIAELATWYGTAQAADKLTGSGLTLASAEVGGNWQVVRGNYQLTDAGAIATENNSLALLSPDRPSGLIHLIVETKTEVTPVSLVWRAKDENNYWCFVISGDRCQLNFYENNLVDNIAISNEFYLEASIFHSVQILDDGKEFSLYLNGKLVFGQRFNDPRLAEATGVGIGADLANHNQYLRHLEAHSRSIPIPKQLDLGAPWWKEGKQVIVADDFAGESKDLAGRITSIGSQQWRKDIGKGKFMLTGDGRVKVADARRKPYPGRTFYTVAWDRPDFADVSVDITPPGNPGNREETSRAGLVFWQDSQNYLIINNWMNANYDSASMSCFFHLDGCEELFDAVWTNVGKRIHLGKTYTLRIVFDGMNYLAFINNEPVIYRALTDVYPKAASLSINRVGIAVNWEWGNDTGSIFQNFMAKT